MKIIFFGDSITDMWKYRQCTKSSEVYGYGSGYVLLTAGELYKDNPNDYEVLNRGISGNRITDLYARAKSDVWNEKPDILSILVGVNDLWHEIDWHSGTPLDRFEKIYRMLIEDTLKELPNVKIMLMEPFVLEGTETKNTEADPQRFSKFQEVYKYAKIVRKLADEYHLAFVPLQKILTEKGEQFGNQHYLFDGVHPMVAGAKLISDEWLKVFRGLK